MRTLTGSPQVTFTLDFHQLVTGALGPGKNCRIAYDPLRIVPKGQPYRFGDPAHPVTAYIQTLPSGEIITRTLESNIGQPEDIDVDVTGRGSMLVAAFPVPDDCTELAFWFEYLDINDQPQWDSAFGENYHIRFPAYEIHVQQAVVTSDPQTPYSGFGVQVSAVSQIDSMNVRYRFLNVPSERDQKNVQPMQRGGADPDDSSRTIWSVFGVAVPYRATIAFDLVYTVSGRTFKDDNSGLYFHAPQPQQT